MTCGIRLVWRGELERAGEPASKQASDLLRIARPLAVTLQSLTHHLLEPPVTQSLMDMARISLASTVTCNVLIVIEGTQ